MSSGRVSVGHPVDVGSGAVFTLSTDFRIPGSIELRWRRHYSTVAAVDTWLGPKWTVPYFMRLEWRGDRYILTGAHGDEVYFSSPAGPLRDGGELRNLTANMELRRQHNRYSVLHWHAGGHVSLFEFDAKREGSMALAAISNLSGHRIRVEYDAKGRPARLIQELERRTVEIAYGPKDLIASVHFVGAAGRKLLVRYEYDSARRLIASFDALGHRKGYEYDTSGRMTVESNPLGSRFLFEYDRHGRCTRSAGADGYMERRLEYQFTPPLTRVTDSRGGITHYLLNSAGQVVQVVGPLGGTTTNTFDEHGRLVGIVHPDGAAESFAYDEAGNRAAAVDASGNPTTTDHDDRHMPARSVDANGNGWDLSNRNAGSLYGTEYLPPRVWTYTRDGRGLVVRAQSAGGWVIDIRRDERFRWLEYREGDLLLKRVDFDEYGFPTEERNAEGLVARIRYDDLHRKVEVVNGSSEVTRYRWNAIGRHVERTGPGDERDTWAYDSYGNPSVQMNSLGDAISFEYDREGTATAITNRVGERLEYRRDVLGRVVEEKLFDGRVQRYEYDAVGRPITIHLSDGRTIAQRFDPSGRVVRRAASDGLVDEFLYDKEGRETKAWNQHAVVELVRDRFGNILEEIQNGRSIRYRYDADNNRSGRLLPLEPIGGRLIREYSLRGHLLSFGDERGRQQVFLRDSTGRLIERQSPGGLTERFRYDAQGRLREHELLARSTRFVRAHAYDASGNLATLDDNRHGTFTFGYDALGRLRSVRDSAGRTESYEYDANNTLRSTHRGPRRIGAGGRTLSDGTRELSYAADGTVNEIRANGSIRKLKHDVNGRLVEATGPGDTIVRHEYDPFGRRTATIVNGERTGYLWEVWELAAEVRDGQLQGVHVSDDLRPLALRLGDQLLTPITDHRAMVRELFDETGQLRGSMLFEAYGNLISESGDTPIPFRLRGQFNDPATGLHYNYARHYDPEVGDYTAPDPIGIAGGYNLYAYPRNPMRWYDAYGYECDIPANHPPDEDPRTSTNPPPTPKGPIPGAPPPENDDIVGGKHAPDRTTQAVGALATAPAYGRTTPSGGPVYVPQGQWNSVDAARNAAAQCDMTQPVNVAQSVPIGPNDGTVTVAAGNYPPVPGEPPVTPERLPADRAVVIPRSDGTVHTFPILPNHPDYNNPPAGGPFPPPAGGAPPAGGGNPTP